MSDYQDQWPRCRNFDQCGGHIYLTKDPVTGTLRDTCARCEQTGLAPATQIPALPEPSGGQR